MKHDMTDTGVPVCPKRNDMAKITGPGGFEADYHIGFFGRLYRCFRQVYFHAGTSSVNSDDAHRRLTYILEVVLLGKDGIASEIAGIQINLGIVEDNITRFALRFLSPGRYSKGCQ